MIGRLEGDRRDGDEPLASSRERRGPGPWKARPACSELR